METMTSGTASDWIVTRGISHLIAAGANHAAVAVALSWPWMKARADDSLGGLLHDLRCVVRLGCEGAKDVDEVERALRNFETELVARLAYNNASNAVKDLVAAVSKDASSKAFIPSRAVDPVAHRGAERFRFDGKYANVINIGGSLVAGGCGKNVDVLDVLTGERVEVLEGHTGDVEGVIALPSADAQLPVLVSWSEDNTIRVWHAADDGMGAMRYTADSVSCEVLEGHTSDVQGVIALPSADGQLPVLVSWSWDRTIRVWHAADDGTGAMRYTAASPSCEVLEDHTYSVHGVIALPSADGQQPVLVSWSWDRPIRVLEGHTDGVQGVIALPSADGQLPVLVSWSEEDTIRVWHAADGGTGAMRYTADSASCEVLKGHTSLVRGVIALPMRMAQLPVLISWSDDKTIRVWHVADDGTGAMRYTVDSASCEVLKGHTNDVRGVIALPSADGQLPVLVSWSWDDTIRVWHAADDGTGAMRYTVDSASCEVLEGHTKYVKGVIALTCADGQLPVLVSWSWDNTIRVWHAADDGTGAMRYTAESASCEVLKGHTSLVRGVIALPSADGQLPILVSWSRDRTIRVWHAADDGTGAMRYTADGASCEVLEGHTDGVLGVIALPSADGQLPVLISWSDDKTIRVWHVADDGTGAMRYTADRTFCEVLEGHISRVLGVIALPSADGQLPVLVSWSEDKTIRVWHPVDDGTGAMRYTADSASCEVLEGHTNHAEGVIALPSADGQLPVLVSRPYSGETFEGRGLVVNLIRPLAIDEGLVDAAADSNAAGVHSKAVVGASGPLIGRQNHSREG
ncbi:uncharacterized protein AMSG_08839 [Thecamonas trahens ATCC 50062]|uniref:Uncharacterized protein n=1 Tax=Thecamonas trahens ATCC 50062 TaxID=461836 RepID=A0A0L0DLZ4_THETB|nr:hypothetical protein AMSG_08839 [Thecamonas trahens ATCC 50062]KNC53339.1 hypothetical protein AMSG_08839 [Thecamonas trahens ATCC 50062]|eukprot:XP_013754387.1 hypothetical protein AMSG_08839 [Thecamonas trahens ATCC 50062]